MIIIKLAIALVAIAIVALVALACYVFGMKDMYRKVIANITTIVRGAFKK